MLMKNKLNLNYRQALNNGWSCGDMTKTRKYVSRKIDPYNQPVKIAGGYRKGQYYVELPYWSSSRYSIRLYLIAPMI